MLLGPFGELDGEEGLDTGVEVEGFAGPARSDDLGVGVLEAVDRLSAPTPGPAMTMQTTASPETKDRGGNDDQSGKSNDDDQGEGGGGKHKEDDQGENGNGKHKGKNKGEKG